MSKNILFFVFLISLIALSGCSSGNLNLKKEVTSIDVFDRYDGKIVATIDDKEFINKLVDTLDNAETYSTGFIDFEPPRHNLLFKHNDDVIYEMEYFRRVAKFNENAIGQYWEFDRLFLVELDLPVDLSKSKEEN